jgi:hypothetical protein
MAEPYDAPIRALAAAGIDAQLERNGVEKAGQRPAVGRSLTTERRRKGHCMAVVVGADRHHGESPSGAVGGDYVLGS